jgi:tetratricopeptide (TPR) repeat protein/DNA-binding XRE family transcriptional regulator
MAGLTQEELAKRAGLSLRALSDMERGRTARPSLRSARLLAETLQLAEPARAQFMAALQDGGDSRVALSRPGRCHGNEYPWPEPPRQLPAAVPHFVGRTGELQALTLILDRRADDVPGTAVIAAIAGTPGIGKTALAVYWAHRVADKFPDGQLYVNLRGFDPDEPLHVQVALAGFLRCLGVPEQDVPTATTERAALYRSLLAGRRVLVLLDNAKDAEQVRPLLPGSAACMTVVTSRSALAGLVARDGAWRLDLDLLSHTDAADLLLALIGERAHTDPDATEALASQCARLPLALRIAAEFVAGSPGIALADIADELADHQRRLDLLDAAGDPRTAMQIVFSWSIRQLDDDDARSFRFLGLHPGADFDVYAVAALTGAAVEQARRSLDRLARAYLVQRGRPRHYCMHDLLHSYAAKLAAEGDSEVERQTALSRLFDYYLGTAADVADVIFPADPDRPEIPHLERTGQRITSVPQAWGWIEAERANLLAAVGHAAKHGWRTYAIALAGTVFRYPVTGHCADSVAVHTLACRAAAQTGDYSAEASARIMLGEALAAEGRLDEAIDQLLRAERVYRETGDRTGEARALVSLANASYCQGHYLVAVSYGQRSLDLFRQTGNATGEARAMCNLSSVDLRQGRYRQAAANLQKSLAFYRAAGIERGVASVLSTLGDVEMRRGRYEVAIGHLSESLGLCQETGYRLCEARTLARLGLVMSRLGRHEQATSHLRQALALHTEADQRDGQAEALNGIGEVLAACGQPDLAASHHEMALALANELGDKYEQARAHKGLAGAYRACGETERASYHLRQALAGYAKLGAPEAEQVRTMMAANGQIEHSAEL